MSTINSQNASAATAITASSVKPKPEDQKKEAEAVKKEKPISKVTTNKDISEA